MKNPYKLRERPEETEAIGPAIIGFGCCFTGKVETKTDIVVEGELNGPLQIGGRLIVRSGGFVRSEGAECQNAEIFGLFEGTLKVTEHLTIREKGRIKGEIQVGGISIETGGHFDGNCVTAAESRSLFADRPGLMKAEEAEIPENVQLKDKKIKK